MKVEIAVIKTAKNRFNPAIVCALEIGGKYSESISNDVAESLINSFGLKIVEDYPTTKLNNNTGFTDYVYS